jgi:hypothetical protein
VALTSIETQLERRMTLEAMNRRTVKSYPIWEEVKTKSRKVIVFT